MSSNLVYFVVKRLLAMVVLMYLIATVVFFLAHASPYDPIRLIYGNKYAAEKGSAQALRHLFGLDQSVWQQYITYMGGLLHGHLGYSEEQQSLGTPVWDIIRHGVPVSLKLAGYSLGLALLVGLPVGLISALRQNSAIDHGSQSVMMVMYAVPTFVVAPVAQLIFGVWLKWLPVTGWGDPGSLGFKEMILPVTIFAAGLSGYFAKSYRSFVLEVMRQDYVRTARAKGLTERLVIWLHVGKNTLLPLASIVGPTVAFLIVGNFIIEDFFSIPGIGDITISAVTQTDYSVIEATTLLLAVFVILVNMVTDIIYALIDPRVRL